MLARLIVSMAILPARYVTGYVTANNQVLNIRVKLVVVIETRGGQS